MTERWDRLEYGKSTVSTKGGKLLDIEASVLGSVNERGGLQEAEEEGKLVGRWEQRVFCGVMLTGGFG